MKYGRTSHLAVALFGCALLRLGCFVHEETKRVQSVLQLPPLMYVAMKNSTTVVASQENYGIEDKYLSAAAKEPVKRFLVIAKQRTGSGFLTSLLNNHSSIVCGNEKLSNLNQHKLKLNEFTSKIEETFYLLMAQGSNRNCSSTYSESKNDCPTSVGFKIMYDQGILHFKKDLASWFKDQNVRIIHLVRSNKLQQYISDKSNHFDKKKHKHNGGHVAHPKSDKDAERLGNQFKIGTSRREVLRGLEDLRRKDATVTNILTPVCRAKKELCMTVVYEDLAENAEAIISQVQTFLGVSTERVSSPMVKIHKASGMRHYFVEKGRDKLKTALEKSKFKDAMKDW